ncbi:glucosaminidase domain-containing protein [Clostridium massiliodielmoense]|uniref:glucosaminidase domain-containing protein n=1 Tax=Clostridium massiliodielmoense TaxID=1776385 RepID=UPI0004D790A0|nr:glucosaminidase domain-containing protein [Clostridium massiliodielmoense]KEH92171.1 hypothetical protein Z962_12305 [Clostridium botulinum C/D str. BKT12695]
MRNKSHLLKGIGAIVLVTSLFIGKSNKCYAINKDILEVSSNKQWIINFNKEIDPYSVYEGIEIKDENNTKLNGINFRITNNGRTVIVDNYNNIYKENKTYSLVVNTTIKDLDGKKLVHSKSIIFKVKSIMEDDLDNNTESLDKIKRVPIMGYSDLDIKRMGDYVLKYNKNPKTSVDIYTLAKMFLEEGQAEGIRGDIAFCQSIKETGFFKYGGQVLPEQNNYAGIGALNNEPIGKGAWFKDARDGVRAQIQHLKGYATKEALINPCIDPRYNILHQIGVCGSVYYWQDLNGKWAVPGKNYGEEIIYIYNKIKNVQ